MNAMLGLLEWLEQTELNAEQASVLAHVRQAGNELLGLLNDVLDFSRNETRQLRLSVQPTDLVELCEHVAAVHWSKARSRHLQLRLALDPALPALMELDPTGCNRCCTTCSPTPSSSASGERWCSGPGGKGSGFCAGG